MNYAIDFPAMPVLPVAESNQAFPVGRIYCVGRNYAEHAREMGHDPDREPPFFFMSGTPAGVGPVQRGDKLEGHVDGVGDLTITYEK